MSKPLIKLELENETPLLLGGYDTQCHEWDAFRTQSLKGLWRWWLRAYIAGALYDAGLLNDDRDLGKVVELTGKILGSTKQASKLRIEASFEIRQNVKECQSEKSRQRKTLDSTCSLPRVRLLTISKPVTYFDIGSVKVELTISERLGSKLDDDELYAAIGSLLTALTLNGLGKMGRRGMGTFKVKVIAYDERREALSKLLRDGTIDFSRTKINDLIRKTLEACKNIIKHNFQKVQSSTRCNSLPVMDLVSEKSIQVEADVLKYITELIEEDCGRTLNLKKTQIVERFINERKSLPVCLIYQVKWKDRDVLEVLADLQSFFLRPSRVQKLYKCRMKDVEICKGKKIKICETECGNWEDVITKHKLAWALGLPRCQKLKLKCKGVDEEIKTGYTTDIVGVERRASPFHLAIHKDRAFITVFLSRDWPSKIEWYGVKQYCDCKVKSYRRSINIKEIEIVRAITIACACLEVYLKELDYDYMVVFPVFP